MKTWINKASWIAVASIIIASPAYALKPADEAIIELYQRVEDLQHDVNSLRGKNEQLRHELDTVKKSQKDSLIDVDDRITSVEGKLVTPKSSPPSNSKHEVKKEEAVDKISSDAPRKASTSTEKSNDAASTQDSRKVKDKIAYKRAYDLLKDDPSAAIADLNDFLEDYPSSRLAANAHYWIGETWYSKGKYKKAKENFLSVLKDYKGSNKESGAALKLGYTFIAMEEWGFAKKTLQDVVKFFPDTRESDLAKKKLESITDKK